MLARLQVRFWWFVDYASIFAASAAIVAVAVLVDFAFFNLLSYLLAGDARDSPTVAAALHYFKVGIALLSMALGVVHALHSAVEQWQLEDRLKKGGP